ncbi:MAG: 16S rRNA (adenine(1518)-N(6)/adenine(1519)-N(6))-dimethyltransferase RsmA [Candidatus Acidiferrales bacterium]
MARQRLGQHFLGASGWQKKIFSTLPVGRDDVWIEIGPGHGEMTRHLAAHARRLIAIEADARLFTQLQENVAERPTDWPGVQIVQGDVLKLDLARLAGGEKFRVYGNLPYYITSPILHQLFAVADRIDSIHIVIQYEVAARIVATPGHREYGYLSAACQFYARPKIALKIPPGAFRPPPKVQSALVGMTLPGERASLGVNDEAKFLKFIQLCFSQKRKTLRNNLRAIASDETIDEALAAHHLRPDTRAEQLSLAHFFLVFNAIQAD